ncbi:MAG: hypothetical protein NZ740_09905 [Kiritimatiellae bacterium]|nr:hypothetical protein [Kiritimatiellia bacterium]MDW8459407.1 hypothetical protein [Verrucomicrobiota bacterium]
MSPSDPGDGESKRFPLRIEIIELPRHVQSDSTYPRERTRQRLIWDYYGFEWRLRLPQNIYSYGSILLREPIDLNGIYKKYQLVFLLKPAWVAPLLSVGLADRPAKRSPALADVPLNGRTHTRGEDWTIVMVPLTEFRNAVSIKPDSTPAAEEGADLGRPLDWSCIQEIRLISMGGRTPASEIAVRDLRFQRF